MVAGDPAVMDHEDHIGSVPLRFAGRSDQIPALGIVNLVELACG
jgi:hypothetical protein